MFLPYARTLYQDEAGNTRWSNARGVDIGSQGVKKKGEQMAPEAFVSLRRVLCTANNTRD